MRRGVYDGRSAAWGAVGGPVCRPSHTVREMSARARPIFMLTLRPEPRVDGIKALRPLLKTAHRRFGLVCVTIKEVYPPAHVEPVRQSNARRYGSRRQHRSGQEIGISGTLRSDAKFSHG